EIERIAEQADEQDPEPGPGIARQRQLRRENASEERSAGDEEANPEDRQRRRRMGQHAARYEGCRPEEDVEDGGRCAQGRMPHVRPGSVHDCWMRMARIRRAAVTVLASLREPHDL